MSWSVWSKAIVASCAVTVGLAAGACNRDEAAEVDRDTDRLADTADRDRAGHEGAPLTLTGCLQRGSGINNYILTQVNSPSDTPVATSGDTGAVQREQMRGAKHAYELDGELDNARDFVGKQVRVTGTLADTSNLTRESREARDNTQERPSDREPLDISAGDLAKVDVQSITQIAENCGDMR